MVLSVHAHANGCPAVSSREGLCVAGFLVTCSVDSSCLCLPGYQLCLLNLGSSWLCLSFPYWAWILKAGSWGNHRAHLCFLSVSGTVLTYVNQWSLVSIQHQFGMWRMKLFSASSWIVIQHGFGIAQLSVTACLWRSMATRQPWSWDPLQLDSSALCPRGVVWCGVVWSACPSPLQSSDMHFMFYLWGFSSS